MRVNLAGREPFGIVQPGAEYIETCEMLAERLAGLEDIETGQPLVASARVTDSVVPPDAPYRPYLPDVLVEWRLGRRIMDSIGIRVPAARDVRWERGRRIASGRSGNHRALGWTAGDLRIRSAPGGARPRRSISSRACSRRPASSRLRISPKDRRSRRAISILR